MHGHLCQGVFKYTEEDRTWKDFHISSIYEEDELHHTFQ